MKRINSHRNQLLVFLAATLAFATATLTPTKAQVKFVEVAGAELPKFKGGPEALEKIIQKHLLPIKTTNEPDSDARMIFSFLVAPDGKVTDINTIQSNFKYKKLQTPDGKSSYVKPTKNDRLAEAATAALEVTSGLWILNNRNQASVKLTLYTTFIGNEVPTGIIKTFSDIKVYKQADQMPQYKTGNAALLQDFNKNLSIPDDAKRENLSARITTSFIVEIDGSISNIKLLDTKFKKLVGPGATLDYMNASTFNIQNKTVLAKLSEAALHALKETNGKWEAGIINDRAVRVEMMLPVTFTSSNPPRTTFETSTTELRQGETSTSTLPKTYAFVQEMPRYKAGDTALAKFLADNQMYPEIAKENKTEGMVVLKFVVEQDGQLSGIKVVKSVSPELDKEAVRVLNLTKSDWLPGNKVVSLSE